MLSLHFSDIHFANAEAVIRTLNLKSTVTHQILITSLVKQTQISLSCILKR